MIRLFVGVIIGLGFFSTSDAWAVTRKVAFEKDIHVQYIKWDPVAHRYIDSGVLEFYPQDYTLDLTAADEAGIQRQITAEKNKILREENAAIDAMTPRQRCALYGLSRLGEYVYMTAEAEYDGNLAYSVTRTVSCGVL